MNRFKKTCGSLMLVASLVAGIVGVKTTSSEAAIDNYAAFKTAYEAVKAATAAVAKTANTKVDVTGSFKTLTGTDTFSTSSVNDVISNKAMHTTGKTDFSNLFKVVQMFDTNLNASDAVSTVELYADLAKSALYKTSAKGRKEVMPLGNAASAIEFLDMLDLQALVSADAVTFKEGKAHKEDGLDCQDYELAIKVDSTKIEKVKGELGDLVTALLSKVGNSELLKKFDITEFVNGTDLTITLCVVKDTNVLKDVTIKGTVKIVTLDAGIEVKIANSTTTETVTIPADIVKDSQLAAGYAFWKGGVGYKSVLSGNNTVFQVTGVKSAKVTKLTVAGSNSIFGKSYSVTKAAKNAFKKAKKLKTLVIKNGTLKKAVKKNRSYYGLKKSVKIK